MDVVFAGVTAAVRLWRQVAYDAVVLFDLVLRLWLLVRRPEHGAERVGNSDSPISRSDFSKERSEDAFSF